MDPKITEEIKKQEDALDQSIALNKITVMLLDERKKELKKVWVFFFVVCVAFVALFSVFAYTTHKEKQELMAQLNDTRVDFMEYLDSIEYTVTDDYSTDSHTETTQTVDGDQYHCCRWCEQCVLHNPCKSLLQRCQLHLCHQYRCYSNRCV